MYAMSLERLRELNIVVREKKFYGVFYRVRLIILKTDQQNLTYRNVTLTVKFLRWKLYLQVKDFCLGHVLRKEVHQEVQDTLSYLCEHHMSAKDSNPVLRRRPWYLLRTSTTYGESLSRFSSEFLPKSPWGWVYFPMVFSGWSTPHISVPTTQCIIFCTSHILRTPCISTLSSLVDQPPQGGGIVTQ
jgi:hypothetical protein